MRLQIGAGNRLLDGFTNTDIDNDKVQYGDAKDLFFVLDDTVEIIFTNAVFEHFFPQDHQAILSEWRKKLTDDGFIMCLGIPDYVMISVLYLSSVDNFQLDEVAKYLQGEISYEAPAVSQFHKALFDIRTLQTIFEEANFNVSVFRYIYPNEIHSVNLGVIASKSEIDVLDCFSKIPTINDYIVIDSITEMSSNEIRNNPPG